ncbi:hypothetical protein SAURM35S_00123 [Streptomyces aurantiogriseus]
MRAHSSHTRTRKQPSVSQGQSHTGGPSTGSSLGPRRFGSARCNSVTWRPAMTASRSNAAGFRYPSP